jgi:hypothetical protein
MDVLERLVTAVLDLLPAGLVDRAYGAIGLGLHVAVAGGVMLVVALSMAVLLQRRDQLLELAADERVSHRQEQPARIGTELAGVVGRPLERGSAVLERGLDGEHDRRQADAQLGALMVAPRQEHHRRWAAGGRRGRPEHAHRHGAPEAQVGVLR